MSESAGGTFLKIFLSLFSYGGIHSRLFDCLRSELGLLDQRKVKHVFKHVSDDALISRSRSKALSDFLRTDCDVYFALDHDIAWLPGDLLATADMAHLKKCIVAGMYSVRGKAQGCAGRLYAACANIVPGKDELFEAEYIPGGFTAIPRLVAEEVLAYGARADLERDAPAALSECIYNDGTSFWPFFGCFAVPSKVFPGKHEFLSEDWAFSERARRASPARAQYLWSKPLLAHYGEHGFMMVEAGQGGAPKPLY